MSTSTDKVKLGPLALSDSTREGRMLSAGRLTLTVTSKRSGRHVTMRLHARVRTQDGAWQHASFEDASHVFVEDYDGEKVATYYPLSGVLFYDGRATPESRWAVQGILRYLAGVFPKLAEQAEIFSADFCGKCGRELTDPESIERGFGPECYGLVTGSRSVKAVA